MKVLHILAGQEHSSASRQVQLLAPLLAKRVDLRVCLVGCTARQAAQLPAFPIDCLNGRPPLFLATLWRLKRLLADFAPDHIHVWRPKALRMLAMMGPSYLARTVVSQPLPSDIWPVRLGMLDRWLLGRVNSIHASSVAEAVRLQALGIASHKIAVIPPAVPLAASHPAIPSPTVVCVGTLRPHKGYENALWAFDLLAFPHHDLRIRFIGSGPHRRRLRTFANSRFHRDRIHFDDDETCIEDELPRALACWVPSLTPSGAQTIREAMAAGCPVIASDWPEFRELIADGETGYLVPSGDKVSLARCTRRLLLEPGLREAMGAKSRQEAQRFSGDAWVEGLMKVYRSEIQIPPRLEDAPAGLRRWFMPGTGHASTIATGLRS